jgi:hypothetical protein
MIIGSRRTPSRSGIQESDAAGELSIRAAPRRDPGLYAEKLDIPVREDEDAAVQFVARELGPPATADAVAFTDPVEGEVDGGLPVALDDAIVEPDVDGDKAHGAPGRHV